MIFKEFKKTLNRPPYQVIKGIHVKDESGEFRDILDDANGVKYDHLLPGLVNVLNDCEVVKGEVFSSECIHVYLDLTVSRVSKVTAVEIEFTDGATTYTEWRRAR